MTIEFLTRGHPVLCRSWFGLIVRLVNEAFLCLERCGFRKRSGEAR
jgi:hypothetical protein